MKAKHLLAAEAQQKSSTVHVWGRLCIIYRLRSHTKPTQARTPNEIASSHLSATPNTQMSRRHKKIGDAEMVPFSHDKLF